MLEKQQAEIKKLKKQLTLVKNQNSSLMAGKLPCTVKKRVATEMLTATEKYSPATIDQMLKPKKTEGVGKGPYRGPRCKNWGYEDFASGFQYRLAACNKAFNMTRNFLNFPMVSISAQDKRFWWMHIDPPWIMSVFEYLTRITPDMEEYEKFVIICFDEIYVCIDCEVDLILDMALNTECKKCVQIMTVKSITKGWFFPFYVMGNHAVTTWDINESIGKFESAGLYPLAIVCDQGAENRALAPKLGITNYSNKSQIWVEEEDVEEAKTETTKGKKKRKKKKKKVFKKPNSKDFINYFEHPYDPDKILFWIWDIIHLMKSMRNSILISKFTLPDGSICSVDDLWDLLEKTRNDVGMEHTSCFHLTSEHLLVEGSDLQHVGSAWAILSERTGNALIKYFPNDKAKQSFGKFLNLVAKAIKILTSRCKKDKKDHLKSAFRIYYKVGTLSFIIKY